MNKKMTISKQIINCYEYVEFAEKAAANGAYGDSSRYWKRAAQLAIKLLDDNAHASFLDDEYKFLVDVSKHFKDEEFF
jgi:hypothetical protein